MRPLMALILILSIAILSGCTAAEPHYEGELSNDLPHGKGRLEYPNGVVYEGEFNTGNPCGEGIWEHPNGTRYEGQWQNGLYHGEGTLTVPGSITYEGQWRNGVKEGYGVQTWADGRRYEGQWQNGLRQGTGTMLYADGSLYEGQWAQGRPEGRGTFTDPEGEELSGFWEKGEFVYIPVQSIALSSTELELYTDSEPQALQAFILPGEATDPRLTWSSVDPEVATVENGLVTPEAPGTTVITAAARDEASADCQVTVENPVVAVRGVEINPGFLNISTADDPAQLQAAIEPAAATDPRLTWSSEDPEVATVTQYGLITPLSAGETEITAVTIDGGYSDTIRVRVYESLGLNRPED